MRSDNLSRHVHKQLPNNDHLSKDIDKEDASKNTDVYAWSNSVEIVPALHTLVQPITI